EGWITRLVRDDGFPARAAPARFLFICVHLRLSAVPILLCVLCALCGDSSLTGPAGWGESSRPSPERRESAMSDDQPPSGEPALPTFARPKDANANGDIFGGWLMAQMDLAGAVAALRRAGGRVATVAVDAMQFHKPVMVGDLLSCYATVVRVGRSSITIKV